MEKKLSFVCMPSLKEITLRTVAISLWNEPDILDSIESFYSERDAAVYTNEWCKIVKKKVIDKISKFLLPKLLRPELLYYITFIGLQIQQWKWFHYQFLESLTYSCSVLTKLCWTSAGTVDFERTAVELAQYEKIPILKRFKLACFFCLEDCIPDLWKELPKKYQKVFYNEEDTSIRHHLELELYWPYILKGKPSKIAYRFRNGISFNQFAFEYSAAKGNKAAVKYFLNKLTQEEKETCFVSTARLLASNKFFSFFLKPGFDTTGDVFVYLLSQMNREQQMEVFKKGAHCVMSCILEWPRQHLFSKIADLIWDFISTDEYKVLPLTISTYFGNSECYSPKIFRDFFIHSPMNFRKVLVDEIEEKDWLATAFCGFSQNQDPEALEVIFRNIDAADRVKLIYSTGVFRFFYKCLINNRSHLIEVCLQEAKLSEKETEKLEKDFLDFLSRNDQKHDSWKIRRTFLLLLYKICGSVQNKRCLEDNISNKAKKVC